MKPARSTVTVDRVWYAVICCFATTELLRQSAEHTSASIFTYASALGIFELLLAAITSCLFVYHTFGGLRWAALWIIDAIKPEGREK